MLLVYPTLTGMDDPTAAPGDGLLPPFIPEPPINLEVSQIALYHHTPQADTRICVSERETLTDTKRALVDGYALALQTIKHLQQQAPKASNANAAQTQQQMKADPS